MTKAPKHTHHGINYIEFYATDMAQMRRFYEDAFGWEFSEYGPDYLGIKKAEGGEAGGIWKADKVKTGGPLVVLYSRDLGSTLESTRKAGGKITKEIFEFPGGFRFEFLDPSGNALGVWSENR